MGLPLSPRSSFQLCENSDNIAQTDLSDQLSVFDDWKTTDFMLVKKLGSIKNCDIGRERHHFLGHPLFYQSGSLWGIGVLAFDDFGKAIYFRNNPHELSRMVQNRRAGYPLGGQRDEDFIDRIVRSEGDEIGRHMVPHTDRLGLVAGFSLTDPLKTLYHGFLGFVPE